MKIKQTLVPASLLCFACAVVAVMVTATVSVAKPPPPQCLDVWNPVICSNGVVYSNACYARRAGATGCVAY